MVSSIYEKCSIFKERTNKTENTLFFFKPGPKIWVPLYSQLQDREYKVILMPLLIPGVHSHSVNPTIMLYSTTSVPFPTAAITVVAAGRLS